MFEKNGSVTHPAARSAGCALLAAVLSMAGGCGGQTGAVSASADGSAPLSDAAPTNAADAAAGDATTSASDGAGSSEAGPDGSAGASAPDAGDGECVAPTPATITLATNQSGPAGIVVDATFAYWANHNDGTIMRAPIDGSSAATVFATDQGEPHSLAIDSTSVYWTDNAGGNVVRGTIGDGSVFTIASDQTGAQGIAVDATNVYWTLGNSGGTAVMAAPKTSSISGQGVALAANGGSGPQGVAVEGPRVYWVTFYAGTVQAAAVDGGSPVTFDTDQTYPEGIAVDSQDVFWTTSTTVMGASLDGGGSPFVLAMGQNNPSSGGVNVDVGIAIDSANVYWAEYGAGKVNEVARAGGSATPLATGTHPLGLTADATSVYWTDYGAGTVMKTSKCVNAPGLGVTDAKKKLAPRSISSP